MEYDESHKNEQSPGELEIRTNQYIRNKIIYLCDILASDVELGGSTSLFVEPKGDRGEQEVGG